MLDSGSGDLCEVIQAGGQRLQLMGACGVISEELVAVGLRSSPVVTTQYRPAESADAVPLLLEPLKALGDDNAPPLRSTCDGVGHHARFGDRFRPRGQACVPTVGGRTFGSAPAAACCSARTALP
ncbi:hypothetical protein [Streptomyces syringium]|uniref:hypothetical protein n=1 Tax=Streptomyces syringium TaxID=76729 RepID=UPI003453431D